MSNNVCKWVEVDEDGRWATDCDHEFEFTSDGPSENKFKWCPYCGKPLVPVPDAPDKEIE